MNVELQLGRRKAASRIFVDGVEQRGVLDFSVDLHGIPSITLKVLPESMKITSPNLVLIDYDVRRQAGKRNLKKLFWYVLAEFFINVREARKEFVACWRKAHPDVPRYPLEHRFDL